MNKLVCAQCARSFEADYAGIKHGELWLCSKLCLARRSVTEKFVAQSPAQPTQPDLSYADARRKARAHFGQSADLAYHPNQPFPARVMLWVKSEAVIIGAAGTYRDAIEDALSRQKLPESPNPKTDK